MIFYHIIYIILSISDFSFNIQKKSSLVVEVYLIIIEKLLLSTIIIQNLFTGNYSVVNIQRTSL